jgi:competence protein ComGC
MKNAKKITLILIIISTAVIMFVGCSSKKIDTTTNTNTTNSQTRKFDPTVTKALYSDTLKNLVTAGTITQEQSDKVLEALTKNVSQGTGINKPAGTTNQNPANKPSGAGKPAGTRPKNNRLSALVTSGVITQAQADTINTKISEAMKNNQAK